MLPYRVISMDACLVRLTTVTGAEKKCTRSISLSYTWLHLQFYSTAIQSRAFIQCRLSKQQHKICICLDWVTSWHLTQFQNPRQWFFCSCHFLLILTRTSHTNLNLRCFPQKSRLFSFTRVTRSPEKCVCVCERERELTMFTVIITNVQSRNRWGKLTFIFWK